MSKVHLDERKSLNFYLDIEVARGPEQFEDREACQKALAKAERFEAIGYHTEKEHLIKKIKHTESILSNYKAEMDALEFYKEAVSDWKTRVSNCVSSFFSPFEKQKKKENKKQKLLTEMAKLKAKIENLED